MKMCKVFFFFFILPLLFSFTLPRPHHLNHQINKEELVMEKAGELELETEEISFSSCEGKADGSWEKEECLMLMRRRNLNAHEDYIYTCGDCPPQNLTP